MFSLAPYRVSIEKDGDKIPLWNQEQTNGFSGWFFDYLNESLGEIKFRGEKKVARSARICANSDNTFICGRYQTGEFGYASDLVDSKSNEVNHQRTVAEAELIPFFFSLYSPLQSEWAILTLQKFKNLGIHDYLVPFLVHDFQTAHPNLRLIVERLVPSTLMATMLEKSDIKAVRFIRHSLPQSIEDSLLNTGYDESVDEVELVLRSKRRSFLPMIDGFKDIVKGKKNYSDVVTIEDWDYDAIKLEVEYAGRKRTIDLGKPFKLNPNIDVSEQVKEDGNGHADWKQILDVSADFSQELYNSTGLDLKVDASLARDQIATPLKIVKK